VIVLARSGPVRATIGEETMTIVRIPATDHEVGTIEMDTAPTIPWIPGIEVIVPKTIQEGIMTMTRFSTTLKATPVGVCPMDP
jgi:hypothetical protein